MSSVSDKVSAGTPGTAPDTPPGSASAGPDQTRTLKLGLLASIGSYVIWGLSPIYWKLLAQVDSFEVVAHRMLWSFVLLLVVARLIMRLDIRSLLRDRRALLILSTAGFCVAGTWWLYIFAINSGHILQASLGYYINPLISILFGVIFFRERLTVIQLIATLLATAGVVYFTWGLGYLPWMSLGMALCFGVYGVLKKKGGYPALQALTVENCALAPIAVVAVAATFLLGPDRAFLAHPTEAHNWLLTLGMLGAAPITIIPLLLFAKSANTVPLSWLGFVQFLSPTITLLLGVFVYGEAFTPAHAICFGAIWLGLAMVSIEMVVKLRRR